MKTEAKELDELESAAVADGAEPEGAAVADGGAVHRKKGVEWGRIIFIVVMLTVPLANWLVFWLGVNFNTILMAFKDNFGNWSLENFPRVWESLTNPSDPQISIQVGLGNTLIYFASGLFISLPLSLILSYFIYKKIFLYRSFRVIFYLPAIISGVAMSIVFMEFIKPYGPLGNILSVFGIEMPPEGLLARSGSATWTIVFYSIWTGLSGNMILLNGAMTRIPAEVLEAARLDGVSPFRELISFILPLIWPSLSSMLVFQFVGILGSSGPILLFAPRGEANTMTLSYWIFYQVYGGGGVGGAAGRNLSMVSAAGLCFTAVSLPITFFVRWLAEKVNTEEY